MKRTLLKSQQGFSLVELMVVVAIIGILASMSVGQVQKQIAKSRQAEVKTSLAQVYTAEKSFNAEFSEYSTRFVPIGLNYEGNLRYDVGFGNDTGAPGGGYTGAPGTAAGNKASAVCPTIPAGQTAPPCVLIPSNGVAATAPSGTTSSTTIFLAEGHAFIYTATQDDAWTIDNNKNIVNATPGIL